MYIYIFAFLGTTPFRVFLCIVFFKKFLNKGNYKKAEMYIENYSIKLFYGTLKKFFHKSVFLFYFFLLIEFSKMFFTFYGERIFIFLFWCENKLTLIKYTVFKIVYCFFLKNFWIEETIKKAEMYIENFLLKLFLWNFKKKFHKSVFYFEKKKLKKIFW
jgi:hypothetical protein